MLAFLRRVLGGFSGAASTRKMSTTASEGLEERLFACLFPGQRYSPGQAALLAGRLREVADSLAMDVQRQPEEPASKKRKKELRGRGVPAAAAVERRRSWRLAMIPAPSLAVCSAPPAGKDLDFSAYQQRYVALELLYLGHEYGGFARQDHMDETIEVRMPFCSVVPAGMRAPWQPMRPSCCKRRI